MRILFTILLIFTIFPAFAAADLTDHPLVSAYEGSDLKKKDAKEFDEYKAFTGLDEEGAPTGPVLEGKITRLTYKNPAERSVLEIFRNYENALKSAGAEIIHQCNQKEYECVKAYAQGALGAHSGISTISNTDGRYMIGKIKKDDHTAYVAIAVGPSFTEVHVAEIKDMDIGMVAVNAAALGDGLDQNGYVIVEGIYFDTDKTTLKPESKPALDEVAKLLKDKSELKLYVVGHTDMQGSLQYNMTLSRGRAEAVAAALVADYGVSAERLEGQGVGPLAPQASNSGESGRAKNRRVVLVAR